VEEAASGISWTRNCEDACWLGGNLKEKKVLVGQTSGLDLLMSSSRLVHHHLYCWTVDKMIQMTHLQSERKCLLLKLPPDGH
jgi:hypothetical protein